MDKHAWAARQSAKRGPLAKAPAPAPEPERLKDPTGTKGSAPPAA